MSANPFSEQVVRTNLVVSKAIFSETSHGTTSEGPLDASGTDVQRGALNRSSYKFAKRGTGLFLG